MRGPHGFAFSLCVDTLGIAAVGTGIHGGLAQFFIGAPSSSSSRVPFLMYVNSPNPGLSNGW